MAESTNTSMVYSNVNVTVPIIDAHEVQYMYENDFDWSADEVYQLRMMIEIEKIKLQGIYKAEIEMLPNEDVRIYREEELNCKKQRDILSDKLLVLKQKFQIDIEDYACNIQFKHVNNVTSGDTVAKLYNIPELIYRSGNEAKMQYIHEKELDIWSKEWDINEKRIADLENARLAKEEKLMSEEQRSELTALRRFESKIEEKISHMEDALRIKELERAERPSNICKMIAIGISYVFAILIINWVFNNLGNIRQCLKQ